MLSEQLVPHGNLIKRLFPNSPASLGHKYPAVLAPLFFISGHICIRTGFGLLRIYLSLLLAGCLQTPMPTRGVARDRITPNFSLQVRGTPPNLPPIHCHP